MLVLLFFVPVLVGILLGLNLLLAVHRPDYEKVSVYECGFPVLTAQTRNPFSISFYLVRSAISYLWSWNCTSLPCSCITRSY